MTPSTLRSALMRLALVPAFLAATTACGLLGGGEEDAGDTSGACEFNSCDENATCSNVSEFEYACTCKPAFFGDGLNCYEKEQDHGDCDMEADGSITCDCDPGYVHPNDYTIGCEDLDECEEPDQGGCEAYCLNTEGAFECLSTVADENSPYWENTCDPTMSQYEAQTDMMVDCRCGANQVALPICGRPSTVAGTANFGEGPHLWELSNMDGYAIAFDVESRQIYLGVGWTSPQGSYQGVIFEVDADTGDRRVLAGYFPDRFGGQTFGAGDPLNEVQNLAFGPDGELYAWTRAVDNRARIVHVDRETGDRRLIWREHDSINTVDNDPAHIQCDNGFDGVNTIQQIYERGFLVDEDGSFLLVVMPMAAGADITPNGIIRIAPDGSACSWVTRAGAGQDNRYYGQDIGRGNAPQPGSRYRGLFWNEGKIWAFENFGSVFEIDPVTGDRTIIAGGIAEDWMSWDRERGLVWMTGAGGGANNINVFHPEEGWVWDFGCRAPGGPDFGCLQGPVDTCCNNHLPTVWDPVTDSLIVWHDQFALLRMEPRTGNSYIFSL